MHQDKDRCAQWIISHYGDVILRMAGIDGFTSWKHLPSEVVAPRRRPDGVLEIQYPNEAHTRFVVVEIETYPNDKVDPQVFDDIMLVAVEKRQIPDVVSIILKPKGNLQVNGRVELRSASGRVRLSGSWPVVRLWELNADQLLAEGEIGLIPWVPLAQSQLREEVVIERCVERIQTILDPTVREGMLVVTWILTGLANPAHQYHDFFGGINAMIESPILDQVREFLKDRYLKEGHSQGQHQSICDVLDARFHSIPPDLVANINTIDDLNTLKQLNRFAATCPDLAAFSAKLAELGK